MQLDSDVALLGTGVAPLVAAARLLAEGKSVLLLNPEWDFFREDSELPLDPLWPVDSVTLTPPRLAQSLPARALAVLRPDLPGAIEEWDPMNGGAGYRDIFAPHVRDRSRFWMEPFGHSVRESMPEYWEAIEAMYVEASDAGLNPQILQGVVARKRFPGSSSRVQGEMDFDDRLRGILIPKICDVDVSRYRNGLLEFIRDRLGPERVINAASQITLSAEGVRFYASATSMTARLKDGMLVFWTPRLTQWVLTQAKASEVSPVLPRGVRLWEEWSLVSREPLNPEIVGMFEDMAVWAQVEGAPDPEKGPLTQLSVLKAGPLKLMDYLETNLASVDSFNALSRLCYGFLKWEKFSIRSMRPRSIFEWKSDTEWILVEGPPRTRVICGCDGPLVKVVDVARKACDGFLESRVSET
jgi:hypothetical protein